MANKNTVKDLLSSLKEEHEQELDITEDDISFHQEEDLIDDIDLGEDDVRTKQILLNSFLEPYLRDKDFTDLSYNGTQFRVQHNIQGRYMPSEQPKREEVERLINNIADNRSVQFNNKHPVLDTEIGFLRVNAMHEEISPDGITMALRISRPELAIKNFDDLAQGQGDLIESLFNVLIKAEQNIIVSGRTGTGKTEFQKKLIGYTSNDSKITLIEDTRDAHLKTIYPEKDINSWKTSGEKFDMGAGVRSALRNNPDWVIIAETRGAVSADILDSAKTDHSIITTIHASSALGIPSRLVPMIRQADAYARTDDMLIGSEIVEFLRFGVQLKAERINGRMVRYIREIVEFTDYTPKGAKGNILYRFTNKYNPVDQTYTPVQQYGYISEKTLEVLEERRLIHLLPDQFNPRAKQNAELIKKAQQQQPQQQQQPPKKETSVLDEELDEDYEDNLDEETTSLDEISSDDNLGELKPPVVN